MMRTIIREATIADAEGIAKVHVDSWKTTYKNIVPTDFLDKLSYEQRTELWTRNLSEEGNIAFVVENLAGQIVGFTSGSISKEKDTGHLATIYILKQYQEMGIGKKLIKEIFSKFDVLGFQSILVEVLEDNDARLFYQALGATLLKSEQTKMAGTELCLLIYEWKDITLLLERLSASDL